MPPFDRERFREEEENRSLFVNVGTLLRLHNGWGGGSAAFLCTAAFLPCYPPPRVGQAVLAAGWPAGAWGTWPAA